MRTFLVYLKLELKRALKSAPYFLAGTAVLAVLVGLIAFAAGRVLYSDRAVGNIRVGVVLPQQDPASEKLISMVSSLESVSSLCEFSYVDEKGGREQMRQGKLYALMLLPEGLLRGIMDGTNTPVTIVFPENAGLEAAVFRELADAGTQILKTAQAAVYAADELCSRMGRETQIPSAEADINSMYLKYALNRSVYFRTEEVSAVGEVGTAAFYGISASVMVLLLLGIPAAGFLKPYSEIMERKLFLIGLSRTKRLIARAVCLWLAFAAVTAAPFFLCFGMGFMESGGFSIPVWLMVCMAAAMWTILIYELARNAFAGICALFLTAAASVFMAGGLIPSVFLPEAVQRAGSVTPAAILMDAVQWMVSGGEAFPVLRLTALGAAAFLLAAAVRRDYE